MTCRACQLGEPSKQVRELVQWLELGFDRGAYGCPKPLRVGSKIDEIRQLIIGFGPAVISVRSC
jgi:hypothetical protein